MSSWVTPIQEEMCVKSVNFKWGSTPQVWILVPQNFRLQRGTSCLLFEKLHYRMYWLFSSRPRDKHAFLAGRRSRQPSSEVLSMEHKMWAQNCYYHFLPPGFFAGRRPFVVHNKEKVCDIASELQWQNSPSQQAWKCTWKLCFLKHLHNK